MFIALLIFSTTLVIAYNYKFKNEIFNEYLFTFFYLLFLITFFLSRNLYCCNDIGNYNADLNQITDLQSFIDISANYGDYGLTSLQYITKKIALIFGIDPVFFFNLVFILITHILFILGTINFLQQKNKSIKGLFICLIIFYCTQFPYLYFTNTIRQGLAISLLYYGVSLLNRNLFYALFILFVGFISHKVLLIFLALLFYTYIFRKVKIIHFVFLSIIILCLSHGFVYFQYINEFFYYKIKFYQFSQNQYSLFDLYNLKFLGILLLITIKLYFVSEEILDENKFYYLDRYMLVSLLFSGLYVFYFGLSERTLDGINIFVPIILFSLISNMFDNRIKNIIYIIMPFIFISFITSTYAVRSNIVF